MFVTVIKLRCFIHLSLVEYSKCTMYCLFIMRMNNKVCQTGIQAKRARLIKMKYRILCLCVFVCICLSLYVYCEIETDGRRLVENRLLASGQKEARESSYQHVGPDAPLHHLPESSITHASLQHCVWIRWCCLLAMSEPTK